MNYHIEPTGEEHIEGFWKVLDSVAREKKYIAFTEGPSMDRLTQFIQSNIGKNPTFVVIADERVVGWCDVTPISRTIMAHVGELGMGLMDGYREQGIGSVLMQTALHAARKQGLTRIALTVLEGNERAMQFYKKFGFEQEGVFRKHARIDGRYLDVIAMGLLFE